MNKQINKNIKNILFKSGDLKTKQSVFIIYDNTTIKISNLFQNYLKSLQIKIKVCKIDDRNLQINLKELEKNISKKTKAIILIYNFVLLSVQVIVFLLHVNSVNNLIVYNHLVNYHHLLLLMMEHLM